MAWANTTRTYGGVAKTLHWLVAVLILTLFPLGLIAKGWPVETADQVAQKLFLFSLHKTLGIAVFFVALVRIVWAVVQPKPHGLHPERRGETALAAVVHWVLYGALVLVPLSGWGHHAATTGLAPIWWPFGQSLPFVPVSEMVAAVFGGLHFVLTKVLGVAILLHVAGALKHHFIDRDVTLRRMMPGTVVVPEVEEAPTTRLPIFVAFGLYALALAAGVALGMAKPSSDTLNPVQSAWAVQDGTIGITVQHFGSAVAGAFADWTAEIDFAETQVDGRHGQVEVTIAIASLTLGSVTSEALGPDYFHADSYATATFSGDILAQGEGYVADGTLTLRGVEAPIALPFTLTLDGDEAHMEGAMTLDRRDFGIGETLSDERLLGFSVEVQVRLTATRDLTQ